MPDGLAEELGLRPATTFWTDPLWLLTALAGLAVAGGLWLVAPGALAGSALDGVSRWISSVIGQPCLEEFAFRGLLQGWLLTTRWGRGRSGGVSVANLATSAAFVGAHFLHHPPLWALSVLAPSLALGWLRERHGNLWAPMAMHALFNLEFFGAAALAVH